MQIMIQTDERQEIGCLSTGCHIDTPESSSVELQSQIITSTS